jgi:hypothetical protein
MHKLEVVQKLSAHKGKAWSSTWHPNGNLTNKPQESIKNQF